MCELIHSLSSFRLWLALIESQISNILNAVYRNDVIFSFYPIVENMRVLRARLSMNFYRWANTEGIQSKQQSQFSLSIETEMKRYMFGLHLKVQQS